ncbi:MAG: hypothetical protein J7M01_02470 [Candidatus Marinimicrobia bacterium]|nr:hypothetical protein [Candidatus Neomarinimicrobiota bacterium]
MKYNPDNSRCRGGKIVGGVILGIGAAILFGFVIKWLWNALLPGLFDLPMITYWQGVGLALLGRLLFGGVGSGHNESRKSDRRKRIQESVTSDKMKDWEYYDKWWNEEGEKSFKDYAGKVSEPKIEEADEITSN